MTAGTPDVGAAAEAATEVAQKAALPIAFIAIVAAAALAVAAIVKRVGASLPLPAYLADLTGADDADEDQDHADDADDDDEGTVRFDQW